MLPVWIDPILFNQANQITRWDSGFLENLCEQSILDDQHDISPLGPPGLTLSSSVHGLSDGFDISHGSGFTMTKKKGKEREKKRKNEEISNTKTSQISKGRAGHGHRTN